MKVVDDGGREIDASFDIQRDGDGFALSFHSRGGSGAKAMNREYHGGLSVVLQRLRELGAEIVDAVVDSGPLRTQPRDARRLVLSELAYPFRLADVADVTALRRELMRAQQPIGQLRGATGGNRTKRIKVFFRLAAQPTDVRSVASWVHSGRSMFSGEALSREASLVVKDRGFDPSDERDARARTMRAIAVRQGQPAFREELLAAYGGKCAISRDDASEALEAAHIRPFKGRHTNDIRNGLLLRADLHVLFDRRLATIDLESRREWMVLLSPGLLRTTYAKLTTTAVHLPHDPADRPSPDAIRMHRRECGF